MRDEQRPRDPEWEDRLFRRQVRPYAITVIVLSVGLGGLAVFYAGRTAIRAYDRIHTGGLTTDAALDILVVLLLVSGILAGWKSVANGMRMFRASVAPSGARLRTLDPVTGYRRSARVGSPTLRFASAVLPVFFSIQFIAGTAAIFQKLVPIDANVLPHYGSMIFLGLAFVSFSSMNSRLDGNSLTAADREHLQPAALRKSLIRGFGLRLAGIWASLLGLLLVIDAFVLASRLSDVTGSWRTFCLILLWPLLYFGFVVLAAGKRILRASRRHLTRVIKAPSDLDGQTYVLYLRTFRSDNLQAGSLRGRTGDWLVSGRSEEEQVAATFRPIGPMVAVGRPGEPLPHVGAIRMYLPREDWQEPVRELMTRARMVVIVLGPGEGTMWEVREALRILPPERLVLLVPIRAEDYRPFRWADLRAGDVRVSLPAHPGIGRRRTELQAVISFTAGWEPVLGTFDRSPLRLSTFRDPLASDLKFQLRPTFQRLREYEERVQPDG